MFASLRRLGVVLVLAALALTAGSSSAWAGTLTRDQAQELRLYGAGLVVARPGAGPALRRAGGVKIATALPVWRVPSRGALQVLPGLVRDGLVSEVSADQPLSTFEEPLQWAEWWIPAVGVDRAVAPGPGKPLTVIDTGVDITHEEFASRPGTTVMNAQTTSGRFEEHGTAVASVAAALGQRARHCRRLPAGRAPTLGREPDRRRNHHRRRHPGPGRRHPPRAGRRQPQPRLADQEPGARRHGRGDRRFRDARRGRRRQQPRTRKPARVSGEPAPRPHSRRARPRECAGSSSRAARSTSTFPRRA